MICYCWSRTEAGTDFTLGSWCALVVRCHCQYALQHCDQSAQQWSNDWYPGGVKIIFHIPSPGLQAYGRGIFNSKHSLYEMSSFALGGLFWSEIPERGFLENLNKFHAVFGEISQNRMLAPALGSWRPLFGEILDPPLVTSDFCLDIKY